MVEKTKWNNNFTFLMAMIGSAVGLGNIWRFPYIFYKYGQGTFLIPYLIAILLLGLPILLLEYAIGYKFKTSTISIITKVNKKFKYVGWLLLFTVFLLLTYYICIVGWDLIYIFLSFFKGWGSNPNTFFVNDFLKTDVSVNGFFHFVPIILLSVFIIWVLVWFVSHRDLNEGIGKITKLFIPLLFVIVIFFVFYALTLPGAFIGYMKFLQPDWNCLSDLNIWLIAFGQVVFTLSLGTSTVITYSSYLPDNVNLTKNAIIVILANCSFELFNALGIFSILGFMSYSSGISFNNLVTEGTGLAFVAFPNILNILGSFAFVIGPLFFLCIFIAGFTTILGILEPVSSSVSDYFSISRKKAVSILCILGFLVSTIFTTGCGNYLITIFDFVINNFSIILLIILECILYVHIYSADDLMELLNKNTLFKVGNWWKYIVKYITPSLLAIFWIVGVFNQFKNNFLVFSILVIILFVGAFILNKFSNKYGQGVSFE